MCLFFVNITVLFVVLVEILFCSLSDLDRGGILIITDLYRLSWHLLLLYIALIYLNPLLNSKNKNYICY